MKVKADLGILINSCDKYDDLWNPYFSLIKENWNDCPYDIYLNTEHKNNDSTMPVGLTVHFLNQKSETALTWSQRLYEALLRIPHEFVLFSLDDFFLQSHVDGKRIERIIGWMQNDSNIANFCLYPLNDNNPIESDTYPGFFLREKDASLLMNCQVAIWRKCILMQLIRKYETPWEFEDYGSQRAQRSPYDFYAQIVGQDMCFPYYLDPHHGYGVFNGRWLFNNKKLFDRHGIIVDYSKRPMFKDVEELDLFLENKREEKNQNNEHKGKHIIRKKIRELLPQSIVVYIRELKMHLKLH